MFKKVILLSLVVALLASCGTKTEEVVVNETPVVETEEVVNETTNDTVVEENTITEEVTEEQTVVEETKEESTEKVEETTAQ